MEAATQYAQCVSLVSLMLIYKRLAMCRFPEERHNALS